jgi:hypothetical protein
VKTQALCLQNPGQLNTESSPHGAPHEERWESELQGVLRLLSRARTHTHTHTLLGLLQSLTVLQGRIVKVRNQGDTSVAHQSGHFQEKNHKNTLTTTGYILQLPQKQPSSPQATRRCTKYFLFGPVYKAGEGRQGQWGKKRLQKQSCQLPSSSVCPTPLRIPVWQTTF